MSHSSWELVVDFLSYKLSQKGCSWSQFEDDNRTRAPQGTEIPSTVNSSPSWHPVDSSEMSGAIGHSSSLDAYETISVAAVKQALREARVEFEFQYLRAFSDPTSQLHITPEMAYQSFEQDTLVEFYRNDAPSEGQKGQEFFNQ
ncbi:bcl-2-like protein 1 [Notamacropus eugenii]|uniref:bcl-2-like protein 1 n=1 Tax=Notamacropus eugenii TaxID=9315 RepID=UPI003B66E71B